MQPNESKDTKTPLIEIIDLEKYFPVQGGVFRRVQDWVRAVDQVSFSINQGETFGLVGESGCGKTTIGLTILRLLEPTKGEIYFEGKNIVEFNDKQLDKIRREMQIIFQDPYSSLNPRMLIGDSVAEGLKIHNVGSADDRYQASVDLLRRVGLEEHHAKRFPHEFSGGQRQRIGIARALALEPKFIVADEPVSALDVSIQAQVLNLLRDLQDEFNLTYLFIAHDMSVVEHISDRVAVMYLGKIVELAPSEELFELPLHPYTQALMSAIPLPNPRHKKDRIILKGDVPSPINPPSGCRFHPRCPVAMDHCSQEEPPLVEISPGHWAACWLVENSG